MLHRGARLLCLCFNWTDQLLLMCAYRGTSYWRGPHLRYRDKSEYRLQANWEGPVSRRKLLAPKGYIAFGLKWLSTKYLGETDQPPPVRKLTTATSRVAAWWTVKFLHIGWNFYGKLKKINEEAASLCLRDKSLKNKDSFLVTLGTGTAKAETVCWTSNGDSRTRGI